MLVCDNRGGFVLSIRTLLRTASIVAALQFAAHAAAVLTYKPSHGSNENAVIAAMRGSSFHFGGPFARSYWEMYSGYALLPAVTCLIEAILFWLLSEAKSPAQLVRQIVLLFFGANLVHAAIVVRYFFPIPLYFDVAIMICLALVLLRMKKESSAALFTSTE